MRRRRVTATGGGRGLGQSPRPIRRLARHVTRPKPQRLRRPHRPHLPLSHSPSAFQNAPASSYNLVTMACTPADRREYSYMKPADSSWSWSWSWSLLHSLSHTHTFIHSFLFPPLLRLPVCSTTLLDARLDSSLTLLYVYLTLLHHFTSPHFRC